MKQINIKYNLPQIKITKFVGKLDSEEYRLKYLNIYINLIEKFKTVENSEDDGTTYYEYHHIVPKCMGGKDTNDNLVKLPIRYHIMAHYILTFAYPEINGLKIALAIFINGGTNTVQERRNIVIKSFSTRTIANMRCLARTALKNRTDDELIKVREAGDNKIGRRLIGGNFISIEKQLDRLIIDTPKMSYSRNPGSHKRNKASIGTGRKQTDETKRKISESRKLRNTSESYLGGRNSRAKKVIGPNGQIFDCIQYAANFANVDRTTMRKWLNNRGKSKNGNHGYRFA